MTALPNAKSMLSSAIDTVNKPYADATATTQETVSRVSSSNFSSIDENGENLLNGEIFLSSCSGGGCWSAPLPYSFPLVAIGRMHGKRRTGCNGVHRNSGQTSPWFSRPREWRLGLAECSLGTRPRQSTLPGPWATTGSGRNGSRNLRLRRLWGRPRLFGRRLCLLATAAAGRSWPTVKDLGGACTYAPPLDFRANILVGIARGASSRWTLGGLEEVPTRSRTL